jgi:hypothetical protein
MTIAMVRDKLKEFGYYKISEKRIAVSLEKFGFMKKPTQIKIDGKNKKVYLSKEFESKLEEKHGENRKNWVHEVKIAVVDLMARLKVSDF